MNTLVILHGWQSSKEKWQKVKQIVSLAGIRVIAFDLPGFKQENELKKPWCLDDYIAWLEGFIKKQKLDSKFYLLGHSFGGRMAIKYSAKNPEKLNGLILVSPGGVESKNTLKILKKRILKHYSSFFQKFSFLPGYELFRKMFYRFVLKKTDYINAKGFLKQTFKNIIKESLIPHLSKIKNKTLIIWGDADNMLPVSDGILMKQKIFNSRIDILKKIGHCPNTEVPELLSQKIIEFIKNK